MPPIVTCPVTPKLIPVRRTVMPPDVGPFAGLMLYTWGGSYEKYVGVSELVWLPVWTSTGRYVPCPITCQQVTDSWVHYMKT